MSPSKTSDTSQIRRWASRQLADYDACHPGTLFAEPLVLEVSQAYALQSAVAELRRHRGERIIGYKVGCTSPTIRAQLGIDHCVSGRLFDSEQHPSGAVLSRKRYANLAIEGELAVELSREPTTGDFSGGGVPACVARVFPVIELHNHVLRSKQPSAGELIANNAIHAGFVAGCGISPEEALGQPSLAIFANDRLLEKCAGCSLIQTMHSSLKWLLEIVRERGDRLGAGQIVLTGSILSVIPIREDCRISIDTSPFGSVEAKFIR
ncbi:MAG: 2-keto-4-pentenoate hydratase [Pirellulaceae bacterium]